MSMVMMPFRSACFRAFSRPSSRESRPLSIWVRAWFRLALPTAISAWAWPSLPIMPTAFWAESIMPSSWALASSRFSWATDRDQLRFSRSVPRAARLWSMPARVCSIMGSVP